MKTEFYFHVDR